MNVMFLVFEALLTLCTILIMLKLSELTSAVAALHTKADGINAKLDAFLPGVSDPAIPADAEAGIATLSEKLSGIEAKIPAVPPAVV